MPSTDCEISLQLKWSKISILLAGTEANQNPSFQWSGTKPYVPVLPLSTQENRKFFKQLKSRSKRTNNWNKYLAKTTNQAKSRYLYFIIDPSFQGLNRSFVLSFKYDDGRESHKQYYLPTLEIKDYNVMIDGRNLFNQPIKNDLKTYDNIRKITTGQGNYYTIGCLLYYSYFKKYYKLFDIDLNNQQKLDADQMAIQKINFTGNLDRAQGSEMFFIIEEVKETVLDI